MASSLSAHLPLFLLVTFAPGTTLIFVASTIVTRDQSVNHFHRSDPLNGFSLYKGGYDIRNKHYWASAAFKGVYGFGMAGIWLLGGLVVLGFYPVWKKRFASSLEYDGSRRCSLILVMMILVFILLMIVSSGLTLGACQSFRKGANKLERTLLGAGGATCHAIRRILHAMNEIHELLCPYNESMCTLLSSSRMDLKKKLVDIRMVMNTAGHLFDVSLRFTYGVTVGIVCLSLALVTAAIVVLLLHWRPGLIMVISMCWVLTTVCWMLTGFHFFLHIYVDDTCSALEEFEQNPSNSSALGSILPCPSTEDADATMAELGYWTLTVVSQLNFNITRFISIIGQEAGTSGRFKFKNLCNPNPPQYNYDANRCLNNVSIDDMLNGLLKEKQHLSRRSFKMKRANDYFDQSFTSVYSDLRNLVHCSFLKDAFHNALVQQCKPLRASIKMLFFSMISLSLSLVILMVAWTVKLLEKKRIIFISEVYDS